MKPILKFCPSTVLEKERCVYWVDEMMLAYEAIELPPEVPSLPLLADQINHQFRVGKPMELLLIADTLTFTFRSDDKHLSALDAYTNRQLWVTSSIRDVPVIRGQGLLLAEPDSFDGDRYSLGLTPRYEIASNQEWVRVVLSDELPEAHYEVASDLVIGLKNEMITEVFFLRVDIL